MRTQITFADFGVEEKGAGEAKLDLVVPFTTPALTQVALDAANRMGAGLETSIRLVKIQIVPYPLDPNQSPVALDFIREQLQHFRSELPAKPEIRLAREFDAALRGALQRTSVVILGYRKRPWRTREERLAASLWRAGYHAVLVRQGPAGDVPAPHFPSGV
jgi:hypothetical protein